MAKSRHPARRRRESRGAERSRRLTPPRADERSARARSISRAPGRKHRICPARPRQHAARSFGNRLSFAVLDCERVKRARHVHDGRITEKARDRLHVERRRHHDDAQIVPRKPRLTRQRKPEVGVNASLVELVEDDRREVREQRILLKARRQYPFGDDEQTRIARRTLVEADLPADFAPERPLGAPPRSGAQLRAQLRGAAAAG